MTNTHIVGWVVTLALLVILAAWERRSNRRGRELLLRVLKALPKDQRDAFIERKFKPHVQEELRAQLREKYHIT